ncbi:MAG TPA: hypothetical protein VGM20_12535 [Gemmatimonadales bacterium]
MKLSRHWFLAPGILVIACGSDATPSTPTPRVAAQVSLVSGDAQQADPQDILPAPVVFRVSDSSGNPVGKVQVSLVVSIGGGSVPAATVVSDSTGLVSTTWMMGPLGGAQILEVRVNGSVMATASATTCDPSDCFPTEQLATSLNQASLLDLATYESSGQTVHPSVVRGHGTATGFWLAITPYPGGNSGFENPSLYRSMDARSWVVPAGVTNPLELPPSGGYLSDPDIAIGDDKRLWLYYRTVVGNQNIIELARSSDGVKWDPPVAVLTAPSHQIVSPAVIHGAPQAPWQMWSVNSGPYGCTAPSTDVELRTSNDGVNWGVPFITDLAQPGQSIWHIDVTWIPARAEYWALYNTFPTGTSCTTDALYLARSTDGQHWTTYPSPVARAGMIDPFADVVYRSTMIADPRGTKATLWISGAAYEINQGYAWHTATVTVALNNLLALATAPNTSLHAAPRHNNLPPPEPDVGGYWPSH